MSLVNRTLRRNIFIRLKSWEYWPFWVVQFPLIFYWMWLSVRTRSLFFFSASNPDILLGGMLGESKYEILRKLPTHLIPKTVLIEMPKTDQEVICQLKSNGLTFPLVFKPDVGERGFLVKRIFSKEDVSGYLKKVNVNFIVQELIDLPVECGVFYTRFPDEPAGWVTSLTLKEMLSVTGDGKSTLRQLILKKDRARLQWHVLKDTHARLLETVLPKDELMELNAIGNHCLGTTFINGNSQITEVLSQAFDRISKQLGNFYFGRYDLKCASLEELQKGNVKIMEVNGCGAEPSHIYQPGYSLWLAYRELFRHWHNLYHISIQNKMRGYRYTPFLEGIQIYRRFRRLTTPQ